MKKSGNILKRVLYKVLPLESYLSVLSKLYFSSFRLGLLKGNPLFDYLHFLSSFLKKGDVCIDIGANLGYLSVPISKLIGEQGKVYAVEPVKPILSVLKSNTKNLKNIEILPYALGEENKVIHLGNNSIRRTGYLASGSHFVLGQEADVDIEFEAQMKKGSELFDHLDKLDFIKCDIEGFEIVVLPELEQLIKKFMPVLLVESGGDNRKKMIAFFKQLGYSCFELYGKELFPANEKNTKDILFVPKDKLPAFDRFIKKS